MDKVLVHALLASRCVVGHVVSVSRCGAVVLLCVSRGDLKSCLLFLLHTGLRADPAFAFICLCRFSLRQPPQPHNRSFQDRSSRLVVSTGARKHLPPPPYGETMGHGLTPPRERDAASAMAATTPIVPCPGTSAAGGGGAVARAGRAPIDGGGTSKIDNAIVDSPGIRQRYREPLSGALAGGMNTAIPAMTTGSRSPSPIKNNFARSAGGGLDALESFSISTRERGREARGYGGVGGRRRTHRLRSASLTSPATSRAAREEEGVGGQSRGRQDIGGVKGKGKGNHRDIDRGIGGGKEFPALPANALSPVRGRHGYRCPAAEGGWIRMRQSQGTLEQLLRTT